MAQHSAGQAATAFFFRKQWYMSGYEHPIDADYIEDGGPVYPMLEYSMTVTDEVFHTNSTGLTLRDHFAVNARIGVVDSISGTSIGDVARFLGIKEDDYRTAVHYKMAEAKARYIYADAMLQARKNK